ncbi:hypothetical protein MXB_4290 [Myxobolus squamalis]|nr:hypothetical protein MXB_4290 [Myxobolus squamalis]
MAGKLKKKGDVGKIAAHLTRGQALRKLQLSLANFRRLCIYKGVFPREMKGKIMYYKKDIAFLAHDRLISFFREERVHRKKIKKAVLSKDERNYKDLLATLPRLDLSMVIKDRYPSFDDAIKDLDDALSLIFTLSSMPGTARVSAEVVQECHRLSIEFLHFVIASKSLKKVFISVKGYYFQAKINDRHVTWIIPHNLVPIIPKDIDFKIIKSFSEFYMTYIGFVNCHLFNSINIIYPPKIFGGTLQHKNSKISNNDLLHELLNSLNYDLKSNNDSAPKLPQIDSFPEYNESPIMRSINTSNLFVGKKFFLSREVPKLPIIFAIKCCGGLVSWEDDSKSKYGVLFSEDDSSITHQIIDRPAPHRLIIGRVYIQPQWIFDSINNGECVSTTQYLPEAILPSHLSPFCSDKYQNLIEQFGKDKTNLQNDQSEGISTKKPMTDEQKKMAALSLPRKKKKLYDKLIKIRKTKETKLEQKRTLLLPKDKPSPIQSSIPVEQI